MSRTVSVKSNIIYNIIFTISTYVAALIVYPYASRVIGVENIGVVGFVLKTIDGFVIFTTLGATIVGIREVASSRNNQDSLSKVFSGIITILTISTIIATVVYIFCILFIPKLNDYYSLFLIGISKLIASTFLIEWFYQGIEDFRYITLRNLVIKILYIISVFLFVRGKDDYCIYFILNVLVVLFSALINWGNARKYVCFKLSLKDAVPFITPVLVYGAYQLLNAIYSTFNYTFLGSYCSKIEVGYYYTAEQFYTVFIAIITAITKVLMPKTSSLLAEKDYNGFNLIIERSFAGILTFCIPLSVIGIGCTSSILNVLVGHEFAGAVLPMQIMLLLILINGINQIFIIQVAMPLKLDREILIGTLVASIMALSINKSLLVNYGAIGASLVLVISVVVANIYPIYIILKRKLIIVPIKVFVVKVFQGIPYVVICIVASLLPLGSDLIKLLLVGLFSAVCFFCINKKEIYLLKK